MGSYPPHYAYPSAPPMVRVLPDPPRLHWGWVFGLSIITFGFFGMVWLVVQSFWVKKVTGISKPFIWALAYLLFIPAMFLMGIMAGVVAVVGHIPLDQLTTPLGALARIVGIILYIAAAYTLKHQLENGPINLHLGGVMTFFFAPTYFQYNLQDFQWDESSALPAGGGLGLSGPMAPIVLDATSGIQISPADTEKS